MAVHHRATIVPTKMELLQAWVPNQSWLGGADTSRLVKLGSYRFDDPDGEVGIETHLLGTADGQVLQVPLTYRGSPRESAADSLVTTMTHTTLGDRWIYDACHDPVYVAALVTAIVTGAGEADLFMATEAGLVPQPVETHVGGSGSSSTIELGDLSALEITCEGTTTRIHADAFGGITVTLFRRPAPGTARSMLTGTWPGQTTPLLLATIEERP
jgi:Maltokinase N-terminal cap domain